MSDSTLPSASTVPSAGTVPSAPSGRRYVIRGGTVVSMDPAVGDFESADVLVEGTKIVAIGPGLDAGDAEVIDARGRIVVPGFVDTHHHLFETALRSFLPDALLFNDGSGTPAADPSYVEYVLQKFAPAYRPQDVYINSLFGGLSQLDAGVTTVLDISQIHHSPEHTDAAVQALVDTGRRAAFGYFEGDGRTGAAYPEDAYRVRKQWFSSDDQLVTMVMGGEVYLGDDVLTRSWTIARELGLPIAAHAVGSFGQSPIIDALARGEGGANKDLGLGPDVLLIHMTGMSDLAWKAARDAGTKVSVAVPVEMVMRHGTPPLLKMQEMGLEPSLSSDVETTMAADPFTLMRSALTMQRMLVNQAVLDQGGPQPGTPALLRTRDALRFATANGADHLGLGRRTGSLTVGKEADIVLLDATALNVAPVNNAVGAVVSLMDRSNVETVIVAGQIRKWKGQLLGADLNRLGRELEESREYLFRTTGVRRNLLA
ncbi:amidohydrolase family protein [Actinoplanes sp. M2I2]|uniref:amidohydrolase family protein n=1 Tax=Actinoplanes sp. M2I2 TaxID=1734444 RepID=UPI0027E15BE8|nr:amidohydrolase family protein [Actinoplanes sp. M2I2]